MQVTKSMILPQKKIKTSRIFPTERLIEEPKFVTTVEFDFEKRVLLLKLDPFGICRISGL